jgi:hypothetical protein
MPKQERGKIARTYHQEISILFHFTARFSRKQAPEKNAGDTSLQHVMIARCEKNKNCGPCFDIHHANSNKKIPTSETGIVVCSRSRSN